MRRIWSVIVLSAIPTGTEARASSPVGCDSAKLVKEIRLSELRHTDRSVVVREMASRVGEPFRRENLREDRQRLDRLGIFSSICLAPIEEADGVVVDVKLRETSPYLLLPSFEITEENGVSAGLGLRAVNLFRQGISFSAAARFGGTTNVELNLKNPWVAGDHLSYQVEFYQRERVNELDQFRELATEVGLRIGGHLGDDGRLGGRFQFLSLGSDVGGVSLSPDGRDNIPTVGLFLGYDDRDVPSDPHRGWWGEIDLAKSGGFLGGDGDYWTLNLDARRYQPLAPGHMVALSSLTTLQSGRVGSEIPLHQDFHIGGTNTVRGWGLGARNGKNQFLSTAEYRYTVMAPRAGTVLGLTFHLGLQLAVFGDLGTAWGGNGTEGFIGGYGVGLRLVVPFVEMIRLDLALGEPGRGVSFHVALWEKAVMQRARVR